LENNSGTRKESTSKLKKKYGIRQRELSPKMLNRAKEKFYRDGGKTVKNDSRF
jgi:hypothetical protein